MSPILMRYVTCWVHGLAQQGCGSIGDRSPTRLPVSFLREPPVPSGVGALDTERHKTPSQVQGPFGGSLREFSFSWTGKLWQHCMRCCETMPS